MYSQPVTTGCCCGINGCTTVTVERLGEFDAYAENMLPCAEAEVEEMSNRLSVTTALICKTAQGMWEYLAVEEGQVIDINGEKLMVRRF